MSDFFYGETEPFEWEKPYIILHLRLRFKLTPDLLPVSGQDKNPLSFKVRPNISVTN